MVRFLSPPKQANNNNNYYILQGFRLPNYALNLEKNPSEKYSGIKSYKQILIMINEINKKTNIPIFILE